MSEKNKNIVLLGVEHSYNILIMLISLVIGIFLVDINYIIGFAGAVAGFIFMFLYPGIMHKECVQSKAKIYK